MKFKFHFRFSGSRFEIRARVNRGNFKFDQGRMKFVRISEEIEVSEFVTRSKLLQNVLSNPGEIRFSSS